MKTLIFQSGVPPFVQQAARALEEAGWLARFVTTFRHDSHSRRQRMACSLARLAGYDLNRQFRRRAVTEVSPEKVESHPWTEVVRLAAERFDRSGRLGDLAWEWAEPSFDRLVSRRLHRDLCEAVYGFEYGSLATFNRARELGLRVFYDMPAPEPIMVRRLLDEEAARFPVLRTPYFHHTEEREDRRAARRKAEWDAAHLVMAASRFTRDSFSAAGLDASKVRIVPYGAPPAVSVDQAASGGSREPDPLRLLWVGTFSVRKGAHYLLDAWRRHDLAKHATLRVFGAVGLPDELLKPVPPGVEFLGSIPRSELDAQYQQSDALTFPTLCDGFGMVATEAWSQGLPVLTTDRAGAADFLRDGVNGKLHPAADADAIAETVRWCLEHRAQLRSMREAARETAVNWQWSDYRRGLVEALMADQATL